MARRGSTAPAEAEEAVRERFEQWRRDPQRGRRIPEGLWGSAVELASQQGVWRTARVLRVNNQELKKRVDRAGVERVARPLRTPFVELAAPLLGASTECVVEMEDRQGRWMRVQLRGSVAAELAVLTREFRRSER